MSLPSSMADFVPCDRLLQKAYRYSGTEESNKTPILRDPGADRGGKGKSKRAKENGDKEKHSSARTTVPFRLPLASAIGPWVSEDVKL